MQKTSITCDVCKRELPERAKKQDDQVYSFSISTQAGRPITGPVLHPDICRKCLVTGFTVSMNENADVDFKLIGGK